MSDRMLTDLCVVNCVIVLYPVERSSCLRARVNLASTDKKLESCLRRVSDQLYRGHSLHIFNSVREHITGFVPFRGVCVFRLVNTTNQSSTD